MQNRYTRYYKCQACGRTTSRTFKAGSRSPSRVRHWCGGEAVKVRPERKKANV